MTTTNQAPVTDADTSEDEVFYAASFIKRRPLNPTDDND
jgi:hypothetical protein